MHCQFLHYKAASQKIHAQKEQLVVFFQNTKPSVYQVEAANNYPNSQTSLCSHWKIAQQMKTLPIRQTMIELIFRFSRSH